MQNTDRPDTISLHTTSHLLIGSILESSTNNTSSKSSSKKNSSKLFDSIKKKVQDKKDSTKEYLKNKRETISEEIAKQKESLKDKTSIKKAEIKDSTEKIKTNLKNNKGTVGLAAATVAGSASLATTKDKEEEDELNESDYSKELYSDTPEKPVKTNNDITDITHKSDAFDGKGEKPKDTGVEYAMDSMPKAENIDSNLPENAVDIETIKESEACCGNCANDTGKCEAITESTNLYSFLTSII